MRKLLITTLPCLLAIPALAQTPTSAPTATPAPMEDGDETVVSVTATRNPQPVSRAASSVTVITREQIEARHAFDLTDALQLAPGINLAQNGTRGKLTSIFTRGTESNHTLVLIDGVRANDPNDGRFDPGTIPVENIERIEVVRGPQSAVYGSDAIGGVINIITRTGAGPFQAGFSTEYGTDATNRQALSVRGAAGKTRLSLTASRLDSDGTFDDDQFRTAGTSLRLDRALNSHQNLALFARLSTSDFGIPGQRGVDETPWEFGSTHDANISLQWTNHTEKRDDKFSIGTERHFLKTDDSKDPRPFFAFTAQNRSRSRIVEGQSTWHLENQDITAGFEQRAEKINGDFNGGYDTRGLFIQDEIRDGKFTFIPGGRQERNSKYGNFTSVRLAGAYDATKSLRLKASYGTSFKAPSLADLYFPGFSNPDLRPERSKGGDIGARYQFSNGGSFEAAVFRNQIRDLIGLDATFTPQNIDRARTQGAEMALDMPIAKGLRAHVNQTFTRTQSSANQLRRRPKYSTNADLIATHGRWTGDLGVLAQGEFYDAVQFEPIHYIGGFTRWDLSVGYNLNRNLQVYVRAQNLFDKDYATAAGYPAQGFNFVVGVKTLSF